MSLRACRAGDAFEVERKLEKRYEDEEKLGTPGKVIDWINRALNPEMKPCQPKDWKELQMYLRDGVALCKLMNKLLAQAGIPKIKYRLKANTAFVAMNNIDVFNKACVDYGVPETSTFQTADLWEGRKGPFLYVINAINSLGFVANGRGFECEYEAIMPPKADWAMDADD